MTDAIVATTSGKVRGTVADGVCRFYGVPYAEAPVGAFRFAPPALHAPWSGERDATQKAPNAPQIIREFPGFDTAAFIGEGWRRGDDYLIANIWTPDPGANGLPVMLFIHGGAFIAGTSDAAAYDGASFARNGIVCITINYRMGAEGFTHFPDAPTNLGLRDQIAALQWVQHNAKAFGGDPGNVTVFGESAGAMSIGNLLGSPLAQGLFRRAIMQSGHGSLMHSRSVAERTLRKLAEILGLEPTANAFRTKSLEECAYAVAEVSLPTSGLDLREADGLDPSYGLSKFLPLLGDDVVPETSLSAVRKGAGAGVELLIGTTTEEMNIYFVPTGVVDISDENMVRAIVGMVAPHGAALLEDYGMGKGKVPGAVMAEALTDAMFRQPARAFAEAHGGRTHVYEFGWRSPALNGRLGACHALELPFVFNTLSSCAGPRGFVGENPPQELAEHIHQLWVAFAKDGTLPWPEFEGETRQVYRLDTGAAAFEAIMPAAKYFHG